MSPIEVIGIVLLSTASFGVVGIAWVGSIVAYAAVQYLPSIAPPAGVHYAPVAWSLVAAALLVWLSGAAVRPR